MCYSRSYFPHFLPQTLKSQTYIYHVLKNSLGGLSLLVVPAWPRTWFTLSIMRSVQSLFSLTPRLTILLLRNGTECCVIRQATTWSVHSNDLSSGGNGTRGIEIKQVQKAQASCLSKRPDSFDTRRCCKTFFFSIITSAAWGVPYDKLMRKKFRPGLRFMLPSMLALAGFYKNCCSLKPQVGVSGKS